LDLLEQIIWSMDTPEILINCWGFYSLSSQLFVIFVDGCLPYRADMGRAVRRIVRVNVTIGCLHVAVAFQQIFYVPQKRVFLGSKGRARFWRWTAFPLIPARAVRMKAGKDPEPLSARPSVDRMQLRARQLPLPESNMDVCVLLNNGITRLSLLDL
jgi:hypothetical protein